MPAVITSDQGTQFIFSLWAALCSLLNIQHSQMTAYHLKSNQMKHALHARFATANWVDHVPWVLLDLRAAAREDNRTTPAQSVFGSPSFYLASF